MEGCATVSVPYLGSYHGISVSHGADIICNNVQGLGYIWSVMTSKTIRVIINNSLILKTVKDVQSVGII